MLPQIARLVRRVLMRLMSAAGMNLSESRRRQALKMKRG
jgi:hypothetical protein